MDRRKKKGLGQCDKVYLENWPAVVVDDVIVGIYFGEV